jgi:hypothetical protein
MATILQLERSRPAYALAGAGAPKARAQRSKISCFDGQ